MLLPVSYTEIENKALRYFTLGKPGNPYLFLLHGYPDNLQIWHKVAPLLAEKYFVIGFDWPGMGYSQEWKGGATPLAMARRLKQIAEHFNIDKAAILAQDMGGQAGLVYAAIYPEHVSSITVLNSLLMWNEKTSWEIELLRKFRFNEFVIGYIPYIVFRRATHTFVKDVSFIDNEVKSDLWNAFKKKEVRSYIIRMCAGYNAQLKKLPDYYKQITCPVLLIWAENGKHFSINHAHAFKKLCTQTVINTIKDSEHWMVLNKEYQIAALIEKHSL